MSGPTEVVHGREELVAQYDRSVDEYRFQVDLNWKRTQYFFALNVAVTAAAVGLLSAARGDDKEVLAALLVVGVALAALAAYANRVQHGYYAAPRDRMVEIQDRLGLSDIGITTTQGMGSGRSRRFKVKHLQEAMFVLIAEVDVVALAVVLC